MKLQDLVQKLNGIQTVKTIMRTLGISRQKAIYYIYRLRKKGYVKTRQLSNHARAYTISFENRLKGSSFYDIINKYSPVKIAVPNIYKIYGSTPCLEEALIYAIKTQSLRVILAALALFRRIDDWNRLYRLAKNNHIEQQVGALYSIARTVMRVRRMPLRFRNNALPKDKVWHFIIPGLRSDDFKSIEQIWRIYIPFNKKDLEAYKI